MFDRAASRSRRSMTCRCRRLEAIILTVSSHMAGMRRSEMHWQQQGAAVCAIVKHLAPRRACLRGILAETAVEFRRVDLDRLMQHIRRADEATVGSHVFHGELG